MPTLRLREWRLIRAALEQLTTPADEKPARFGEPPAGWEEHFGGR